MNNSSIVPFEETEKVALAMQKSNWFKDVTDVDKAVVKILAGREMGFGPFASMRGVYIIQGTPALAANLMAAAVKRSGRYNYKVKQMLDTVCEIEFFENGQACGSSTFTADDARRAGTQNMGKFPRNMLFARAMSNGVRWYCPDVLGGSAVYTPEELGAEVNEDGDVIEASFTETTKPVVTVVNNTVNTVQPEPVKPQPATVIERLDAKNGAKKAGPRPYSPDALKDAITAKAGKHMGETISDGARGLLVGKLDELFDGNTSDRHRFTKHVTGYGSTKNMPVNFMKALEDWITYDPAMARREAKAVIVKLDGEASAPLFTDESEK